MNVRRPLALPTVPTDASQQSISTRGLEMHPTWKRREHRHVYHQFWSWFLEGMFKNACSNVFGPTQLPIMLGIRAQWSKNEGLVCDENSGDDGVSKLCDVSYIAELGTPFGLKWESQVTGRSHKYATPTPWSPIPRMASAYVQTIRPFSLPLVCSRKTSSIESLINPRCAGKNESSFQWPLPVIQCYSNIELKYAKWLPR